MSANKFHFETWRLFDPAYLFFCIPITIHYMLVLRAIQKLKESNAFYFIFLLMGISDVVYCCVMLICELLHHTNILPQFVFVVFVVLSYYGVFFNLLSNALLSINRLCATCVCYKTYFDDDHIKSYFVIISIIAFVATLPGGVLMFIYMFMDWSMNAQYGKSGVTSFNTHRTIIISMMLGDAILGIVSSLCTIYRLRKYKISYEKNLLLVTSLHILPDTLVSFFNLDMVFQFTGESRFMNELSRMFLFFLVSFNSLTIVCTNRAVRKEYLNFFTYWKETYENTRIMNSIAVVPNQGPERITIF